MYVYIQKEKNKKKKAVTLPEGVRASRPDAQVPRLTRLKLKVQHVCPVQLLILGHNEGLAVALDSVSALCPLLLGFQRQVEELSYVTHQVPNHIIWHSMVDELRAIGMGVAVPPVQLHVVYTAHGHFAEFRQHIHEPTNELMICTWKKPQW